MRATVLVRLLGRMFQFMAATLLLPAAVDAYYGGGRPGWPTLVRLSLPSC